MCNRSALAFAGFFALASFALSSAPSAAEPGRVITDNCTFTRGSQSCVTIFHKLNPTPHIVQVRQPISDQESAEHQARDKRWQDRCKPATKQDHFGVERYVYTAPGCEFGKLD